ncbi:MAG TPA: hypothetical protein VMG60_11550 [Burkholderiaceae bacterium]|nr:hypothetical protein [Burkholderiaceae bacterium]
MQVHHGDDAVFLVFRFVERQGDLANANFGEEQPPQAVELRQGHRRADALDDHAPDAIAKRLRVGALHHFVFEDATLRREDLAEVRLVELLARYVGEDDAEAEGRDGLALERVAPRECELRVALERTHDVEHVAADLFERALLADRAAVGQELDFGLGGRDQRVQTPVLSFEDEHAFRGVDDDEIGVSAARAYGQVVPNAGVVFEEVLEAFG